MITGSSWKLRAIKKKKGARLGLDYHASKKNGYIQFFYVVVKAFSRLLFKDDRKKYSASY